MNIVYVFAFERPDGKWGAVNDDEARLIITSEAQVAVTFAAALTKRARIAIVPVQQNASEVVALVSSVHVGITDVGPFVRWIDEAGDDALDARYKANELAGQIPLDTPGDWQAAHVKEAM